MSDQRKRYIVRGFGFLVTNIVLVNIIRAVSVRYILSLKLRGKKLKSCGNGEKCYFNTLILWTKLNTNVTKCSAVVQYVKTKKKQRFFDRYVILSVRCV